MEVSLMDLGDDMTIQNQQDKTEEGKGSSQSEKESSEETDENDEEDDEGGSQESEENSSNENSENDEDENEEDEDEEVDVITFLSNKIGFAPEGLEASEDMGADTEAYVRAYGDKVKTDAIAGYQKDNPRAHAYALHLRNGGSDEDFFVAASNIDIIKAELKEDDDQLSKQIIKQDLQSKGLTDSMISGLIENVEAQGNLFKEASAIQENAKAIYAEDQKKAEVQAFQIEQRNQTLLNSFVGNTVDSIKGKTLGNFRIKSDEEATAFSKFVESNVDFDAKEGKFYIKSEFDPTKMDKALEHLFFAFKGGDLSGYVQSKGRTQKVKGFKLKQDKQKTNQSKGSKGGLTLMDI